VGAIKRGKYQAREVDLLDHVGVRDQAFGGLERAALEELERDERREAEERVRKPLRRNLGDPSEDEGEDNHRKQRLDNGPQTSQHRLLVSNLDVTPDQVIREAAVLPELFQLERGPNTTRSLDTDEWSLPIGLLAD
jgi:hypothetical protein